MKYIYILLLAIPFAISSCQKNDKDYFDLSASERLDKKLQEVEQILISAENGWKMDIFPSKTLSYGGYTLLLDFTSESVTAASELEEASYTETSLWNLNGSSGPVLSFDTYNSLIHYFSGPNKDEGNIDTGLGGDYDFIILKVTADTITLKGTKTGNINYLTPIAKDQDWEELLTEYQEIANDMTFNNVEFSAKGKTYATTTSSRAFLITYQSESEEVLQKSASYIFTLDGIHFYEPLEIDGISISDMVYQNTGNEFYFEDKAGSGAKIIAKPSTVYDCLSSGLWYFAYSKMGSYSQIFWDFVYEDSYISTDGYLYGETLRYAAFGNNGTNLGFHFNSGSGDSEGTGGSLIYTMQANSAGDELTLTFALSGDNNGVLYYVYGGFNYYISVLGTTTGKTYTVSIDDPYRPNAITLVDKSNANNSYVLYKDAVSYPYTK